MQLTMLSVNTLAPVHCTDLLKLYFLPKENASQISPLELDFPHKVI